MIERPGVLADPERFAADLEDQRLRDGVADVVGGGDAEAGVGQSGDVLVGAGECHRRVNGQRDAVLFGQRAQHRDAVGARGVHDDRARAARPGGGQAGHHRSAVRHRARRSAAVLRGPRRRATGSTAVSGSRRSARCRDACDIALHATTTWSARSSATPSAVPTRPAEMIPTESRAGRKSVWGPHACIGDCSIADGLARSVFRSSPTLLVPDGR